MGEVAVPAGHEVLVKVDFNGALIVCDLQWIIGLHLRPHLAQCLNRVRVNQRNCFPPNVCGILLPASLQWVEPPGGGTGSRICRHLAENGYVNLPLPI